MPRDRRLLLLYLAAVLALTLVHHPAALAAALLLVLLAAGRQAPALLGRALRAVAPLALVVSLGWAAGLWLQGQPMAEPLLRLNLRVLALTSLTFLFIGRVNLFRVLGFSRTLGYLLGLAYSQALTLRRAHDDFRLALLSRSLHRPTLRQRYRASAAEISWLMERAFHSAREAAAALRSRGSLQ